MSKPACVEAGGISGALPQDGLEKAQGEPCAIPQADRRNVCSGFVCVCVCVCVCLCVCADYSKYCRWPMWLSIQPKTEHDKLNTQAAAYVILSGSTQTIEVTKLCVASRHHAFVHWRLRFRSCW